MGRVTRDLPEGEALLVAGDFNAHYPDWDAVMEDERGATVKDWMTEEGLTAANNPEVSTRTRPYLTGQRADLSGSHRLQLGGHGVSRKRSFPVGVHRLLRGGRRL